MIAAKFKTTSYTTLFFLHIITAFYYVPFFIDLSLNGAWSNPVHSHGPLVLLISLFLVFQNKQKLVDLYADETHSTPGVLFFIGSFLLYVLGGFTDMIHFKILSFI